MILCLPADGESSLQEHPGEREGDVDLLHLHGEEQQEPPGPEGGRRETAGLSLLTTAAAAASTRSPVRSQAPPASGHFMGTGRCPRTRTRSAGFTCPYVKKPLSPKSSNLAECNVQYSCLKKDMFFPFAESTVSRWPRWIRAKHETFTFLFVLKA